MRAGIMIRGRGLRIMPLALEVALICWFCVVGVQAARKRDARLVQLLLVSVVCVAGVGCVGVALSVAARHTAKFDLWLYTADRALGSPSFAVAGRIRPTVWYPVLVAVYEAMPMAMLGTYAAHLLTGGNPQRVLGAFALNFAAGYAVYLVFPACGPEYAFSGFPAVPSATPALHALDLLAPPNCMPSLHTSTAVLACWYCRRWRMASGCALANLALTVLATLATGEHYAVDLVAAAPFAAFVYRAARGEYRPAIAWLGAVLAWCGVLRFGLPWIAAAPALFGTVCILIVAAAWIDATDAGRAGGWMRASLAGGPLDAARRTEVRRGKLKLAPQQREITR